MICYFLAWYTYHIPGVPQKKTLLSEVISFSIRSVFWDTLYTPILDFLEIDNYGGFNIDSQKTFYNLFLT